MDISNKSLAVLLVIAIVVSVGGAMINLAKLGEISTIVPGAKGITGFGTTGEVNVSVLSTASLNVTYTSIDFGVGSVFYSTPAARLNSSGNRTNWTVSGTSFDPRPLVIENIGNVDLAVSVSSGKSPDTYYGIVGGNVTVLASTNDSASACDAGTGAILSSLTQMNTGAGNTRRLCANMSFITSQNELKVQAELTIPYTTPTGNKTDIWTFNVSEF